MTAMARRHRVVVVGAGFGGLAVTRALDKTGVDVVLVDANNYHLFQPLLYQVATAGLDSDDIAYPARGIFHRQPVQHVVDRQELGGDVFSRKIVLVQRHPLPAGPAAQRSMVTGLIDQNPPHRLGGRREEVPATVPFLCRVDVDQPQIGFMHEGGGLQCVIEALFSHACRGELAQLRGRARGIRSSALADGDARECRRPARAPGG